MCLVVLTNTVVINIQHLLISFYYGQGFVFCEVVNAVMCINYTNFSLQRFIVIKSE
jgi:hypothetical protein